MRNVVKWFAIATLVIFGILLVSTDDSDVAIGSLMFMVSPILTLVYLGQEKK